MSNQPTNSIDSELEDVLEEMWEYGFNSNGDFPTEHKSKYVRVEEALQAIKAKYVSHKEIEEAIGEDEDYYESDNSQENGEKLGRNELRAELRAKLLPPTKGGNDE